MSQNLLDTVEDGTTLQDLYTMSAMSGIIPADTDTVEEIVSNDLQNVLGMSPIAPETPMGRLVEWLSMAFANVLRINAQNANQLLLSHAAGQQLDALGYLFGVQRKSATHTAVNVVLTGVPGTILKQGTTAKTASGEVFELHSDIMIGSDGTAEGTMEAQYPGAVYCPAGTLIYKDTALAGWSGVTNPGPEAVVGGSIETDAAFRERIAELRHGNSGYIGGMRQALEAIDGVRSTMILENNTNGVVSVRGVALEGHSIFVCVDCEEASYDEVAAAVLRNKPLGCGYAAGVNSVTKRATDDYGNEYDVIFNKPDADYELTASVVVKKRNYTGVNLTDAVKAAAAKWVQDNYGNTLGASILASEMTGGIEGIVPGIAVQSVTFNGKDAFAEIDADRKPMLNASHVYVHLI